MNKFRLDKLAQYLTSIPAHQFNMGTWVEKNGDCFVKLKPEDFTRPDCGATACAFGHACMIPEFAAHGLSIGLDGFPRFGNQSGFRAAEKFFNISEKQATLLFSPESYPDNPTPQAVAAVILKEIQMNQNTANALSIVASKYIETFGFPKDLISPSDIMEMDAHLQTGHTVSAIKLLREKVQQTAYVNLPHSNIPALQQVLTQLDFQVKTHRFLGLKESKDFIDYMSENSFS